MKRLERSCLLAALTIFTFVEAGNIPALTHNRTSKCITDFCTSELRKREAEDTTSYAAVLCVSGARDEAELLSACDRLLYKKSSAVLHQNATSLNQSFNANVTADVAHAHSAEHSSVSNASQPQDSIEQSSIKHFPVPAVEESLLQNEYANLGLERANNSMETQPSNTTADTASDILNSETKAESVVYENVDVPTGLEPADDLQGEEPTSSSETSRTTYQKVAEDQISDSAIQQSEFRKDTAQTVVDNQVVSFNETSGANDTDEYEQSIVEVGTKQANATTAEEPAPANDTVSHGDAQVVSQKPVELQNQTSVSVQSASAPKPTPADSQTSDEHEVVQTKKLQDGSAVHVHYHIHVNNRDEIPGILNKLTEQTPSTTTTAAENNQPIQSGPNTSEVADSSDVGQSASNDSSKDLNEDASRNASKSIDTNAKLQDKPNLQSDAQVNEANDTKNVEKEAPDTIIGSSSDEQLELPQPKSTSTHVDSARSTPQPRSPSNVMFKSTRRLKTFSHMAHSHEHEHKHTHEEVHDEHVHESLHAAIDENQSTQASTTNEQAVSSATGNDSDTLVTSATITTLPDPLENMELLVEPVSDGPLASVTSEVNLSLIAEENFVPQSPAQISLSDEHDDTKEKKFAPSAFDAYFDEPPREPSWLDTNQLAKLAESFVVQADTLQQRCGTLVIVLAAVCCVVLFERLVLPRASELNKVAEKRRVLAETLKLELAKKELECATFLRLTSSSRQRAAGHADAAQKCVALQNDNSKLVRDLETTKAAVNKLRSDYEEMASRAKEVDAHAKALHDRSDLLLAERNELATQIDALQLRYDTDTEDLRNKLIDMQTASQAFENALRELESVHQVARAQSLSNAARKHSLRAKSRVTNGNENNDWLDEAETECTVDGESAREKHGDENNEGNADETENDELDGATPADVQRVFELLIDVNRARKECATQRAELDNAIERLNEASRAVTALNDQLANSVEERNALTARCNEIAAELAALERRSTEDYAANDASLRGQLAQVTERLAEVEERERVRVAELDAKAHDADSEAREMRRKAAELEHECARLRKMVAMQTGSKTSTHNRTADNSASGKQKLLVNRSTHAAFTPTGSAVGCPPSEADSSRLDSQSEAQAAETRRLHADGVGGNSVLSGNSSFSNGSAAPRNAVPFALPAPPFNPTALPMPFAPPADINSAMPRMPFPFPPGFDFTRLPSPFNLPSGFQLPPFGAAPNLEGASRSPATQRRMRSEDERSELSRRDAQDGEPTARRRDAKQTVHEEAGAEAPETRSNRTPQTVRRKQQAAPASRKKE